MQSTVLQKNFPSPELKQTEKFEPLLYFFVRVQQRSSINALETNVFIQFLQREMNKV